MVSSHLLRLDASYSYRTYGGCLEGAPSRAHLIKLAQTQAIELWGERPTFVIPPKEGKLLPSWTHLAWASGPPLGQDTEADGSQLVVIWWGEIQPDSDRVLSAIDWEQYAKNFGY